MQTEYTHQKTKLTSTLSPKHLFLGKSASDFFRKQHNILIQGHTGLVRCLRISVDNRYVVSSSDDTSVRIWDLHSKRQECILNGHKCSVLSLAISKCNRYIVSGSWDSTIRLWSLPNRSEIGVMLGHKSSVVSLAITSDSKYIISGSSDYNIMVWSIEKLKLEAVLVGHCGTIKFVAVSANDKYVASGSLDGSIRIWNLHTKLVMILLMINSENIHHLELSSNKKVIFIDETVKHKPILHVINFSVLKSRIKDPNFPAIVSYNDALLNNPSGSFELSNRSKLYINLPTSLRNYTEVFSDDSTLSLKYASQVLIEALIRLQRIYIIKLVFTSCCIPLFTGTDDIISISSDYNYAVIANIRNKIRLKYLPKLVDEHEEIHNEMLEGHTAFVVYAALTTDHLHVLSGASDCTVRLWNLQTRHQEAVFKGHTLLITSVVISRDNKYLVTASQDHTIQVWSLEHKHLVVVLNRHVASVIGVDITSDNCCIVSAATSGTLRIWNLKGDCNAIGECRRVYSIKITGNDKYTVSTTYGGIVEVWRIKELMNCLS